MATRDGTGSWVAKGVHQKVWADVTKGDDGAPLNAPYLSDKTVQVHCTFGTATVIIEGSNVAPSGPYAACVDPQGNAIAFTVAGQEQILENPLYIRPRIPGGDATTSLTVRIVSRGNLR